MKVFLGLGSNLGDRRQFIHQAIQLLAHKGVQRRRLSPLVESPALLPEGAPADWNLPYLNTVLEADVDCTPEQMRVWISEIQDALGRDNRSRWAPRPMDIDILLWGDEIIKTEALTIPHPDIHKRGFVVTPLLALEPRLTIPGLEAKTLLQWSSSELAHHIPLWMGIANITPDSFSDGGQFDDWPKLETHIDAMLAAGAQIIDIGAESTRPNATPLNATQEWQRLQPILEQLNSKLQNTLLPPLLSIDTYHPEVAVKALQMGADIINDVSGLTDPAMRELAASSDKQWVAMHYVSIPASPQQVLPADCDPVEVVDQWLIEQLEVWDKAGIDLNRIIFDPGIGFGKDGLQSMKLLRQAAHFRRHGLRVLIGHSRKSFMKNFSCKTIQDKDLATVGASLNLCEQGVDIIRVHNVPMHIAAYRGWAHLNQP